MSSNNYNNFYYILMKDNNIISIYDNLEISLIECIKKINELIEFLIEVKKIYKSLDNSFIQKLKNFKIIKYIKNTTINNNIYYYCFDRFLFIDQDGLVINLKSSNLITNYLKYTKNVKNLFCKITESNNCKLQENIVINKQDINDNNDNNDNNDIIDNLKNKINELEKIKNLKETLNENNINNKKEVENYITKYNDEKKNLKISINELKLKKEKLLEHQNIYDSDLKIYKKIKNDEVLEIPLLFKEKYDIFLKLESENNINFDSYFKLLPKNTNVAISSNFKSLFEDSTNNSDI